MKTPEHLRWLKANKHNLAPLTDQDHRTLAAIDACWQLLASSDEDGQAGATRAVRALLPAMQEKCWPLAKELIARALDWSDRDRIWPLVTPESACRCVAYEEDPDNAPSRACGHAPEDHERDGCRP